MSLPLWGQGGAQGSVEGTVADQKGGVLAGATLTLKNTATAVTLTSSSDTNGLFRFPVVPVGTYELTAEAAGFATVTQKDVPVTVGARINLTLTLPVAAQKATVVVTGEAPMLEATRSEVTATVNERSVTNLPVLGRNFINFVLLTPGVTLDIRSGDISFAGQRGTLNSLVVDGADNNNSFFGQTTGRTGSGRAPYQFSQDAVAEFQVNSNSYSAELGRAGGAVINVVTKSGSNEWHGTGFEFYRDTGLNANDTISKSLIPPRKKSPLHFNQFGGNIAGPIIKDKLFFFFDYDGQRNTLPNLVFLNLPKNFKLSSDPAIAASQQKALDFLNARSQSWTSTQNQNVYLGKVDWHVSHNNLLTGRINSQRFAGANLENGGTQNALEHTGASNVTTDTVSLTLTSVLTTSVVNVARGTYLRDNEPGQANSPNAEATVKEGGTVLTIGRNFFSPRFTNIKRGQWGDTLSWVRGRHSFKFGADFIVDRIENFFPGNFSGSYTFNTLESFGRNLAGVAQRVPTDVSYFQAFPGPSTPGPTTNPNIFEFGGFAQDEWRVRTNLTLNLGVRYDLQKFAKPPIQNSTALAAGIDTSKLETDKNNVGPRVGFAWTPLANNRMVVRAGYGIFYGRTPSIMVSTAHSNNGLSVQPITFSGSAIPQYPNNICGAPHPSVLSPSCPPPTGGKAGKPILLPFNPDYVQPFVQQWSLGAEYGLTRDLSVTISYLGVKGTHLQRARDINLDPNLLTSTIPLGNDPTNLVTFRLYSSTRPIKAFGRIQQFESAANSIYHGMTIQVNKRFSQNFQFLASYSFGKVIDDRPDATAVVPGGSDDRKLVQFPTIPSDDRGPGDNDQRHRFVFSFVWDLNYAKNLSSPVARGVLGGWELSGILTAQSGQPLDALVNTDLNNDGDNRTDRFPGVGKNTFTLPTTVSFDPRLTRNISLKERLKLQFIVEAFNIFNRGNIFAESSTQFTKSTCGTAPSTFSCLLPSSSFGNPISTFTTPLTPRIFQLAAKIVF